MEQGKERSIESEQILYTLIELREKSMENDMIRNVMNKVNKEKCREIGIFNYKLKITGKKKLSRLFLINETVDGEEVNIIYDESGRFIAKEKQSELKIAEEIEIEEQLLQRQLGNKEEKTRTNVGTAKEGERDLPKERSEKNSKEKEQDDKKEKNELTNLKGLVNISYGPKIRLDQTINGYDLWQILQIQDKLKGRLPNGISEYELRNGYLCIVDSKQLEAIDGKKRNAEDTFVVQTYSGDIIELDEQILESKELGTRQERKRAEQSAIRSVNGEREYRPDTEEALSRTSLYKIPDANFRFNTSENWFLAVDTNRDYIENGKIPVESKMKEVTFVQKTRNDSYYNTDERIGGDGTIGSTGTLECKLESVEEHDLNEHEMKQQGLLAKKDISESVHGRIDFVNQIAEECLKKYPELGEVYNKKDIAKKVDKLYSTTGMNKEEIMETIVEDAEIEHEPRGKLGKR